VPKGDKKQGDGLAKNRGTAFGEQTPGPRKKKGRYEKEVFSIGMKRSTEKRGTTGGRNS